MISIGGQMANSYQDAKITGFAAYLPKIAEGEIEKYQAAYEQNRHRVYSFAFWMTDSEIAAEELLGATFCRVFASSDSPTTEMVDRALLTEIRELMPIGTLTLESDTVTDVSEIRKNTKRVFLERAIVQVPATERLLFVMHDGEGYSHERMSKMLGISEEESRLGLHQARLRIRELVADMK
jgi:RNA polymerase sigma-70 factor, ECF subfamily